jgi:prepilin-type N-terminal cleavage/methylation domain-containing protein
MKRRKGFTMIELVMVIVILGFLAAMLLPRFIDMSGKGREASEAATVGAVRAGLATIYTAELAGVIDPLTNQVYVFPPDNLDTQPANQKADAQHPFFINVLQSGFQVTSNWKKGAQVQGQDALKKYIGPTGTTYTYVPNSVNNTATFMQDAVQPNPLVLP